MKNDDVIKRFRAFMTEQGELNEWKFDDSVYDAEQFLLAEIKRAREEAVTTVTRLEIIDETGRAYVRHDISLKLSHQDENRTLKVFVKPVKEVS